MKLAEIKNVDFRLPQSRNVALLVPLLLVNTAALYGQSGWAYDHLIANWILATLFALALESIGVYLAAEAHGALMAGDASARLRIGSYLVGVLVGTLNYAHFASADYRPNPLALTFGLLSSISPWLWAIRSRSLNRDRLRELGQVDPRAVRFSVLRWFLFPLRTARAFRAAVWAGVIQPAEAIANADAARRDRQEAGKRKKKQPSGKVPPAEDRKVPPAAGKRHGAPARRGDGRGRPAAETRKLAAAMFAERPRPTQKDVAGRLAITPRRLRDVINGPAEAAIA